MHHYLKLAELTSEEAEELKKVIKQHADYEQKSALGEMTEEMKAKMRHNVDRIKAYQQKKTGKATSIPRWARDPHGVPPSEHQPPPYSSSYRQRPNNPWAQENDARRRADEAYERARRQRWAEAADQAKERSRKWQEDFNRRWRRTASDWPTTPRADSATARRNRRNLAMGVMALGAATAYALHKLKDTERSDKGKTHKKHFGPRKVNASPPV